MITIRQILNILLTLVIASIILSGCGSKDKAAAAAEQITIAEFKTLLDTQADVVVVDVRSENLYNLGHIPGAIRMTYPDEIQSRHQELPTDKTLVLY